MTPAEIEAPLADVWDSLQGSGEGGMCAYKLIGRIEDPSWEPPLLRFSIERHGAARYGSTRAEIQCWVVDMEAGDASIGSTRQRQLRPTAPRFQAAKLATEIAEAVGNGEPHPLIDWNQDGGGFVFVADRVPELNEGFKQTLEGRQRRMREELHLALAQAGWHFSRNRWTRRDKG